MNGAPRISLAEVPNTEWMRWAWIRQGSQAVIWWIETCDSEPVLRRTVFHVEHVDGELELDYCSGDHVDDSVTSNLRYDMTEELYADRSSLYGGARPSMALESDPSSLLSRIVVDWESERMGIAFARASALVVWLERRRIAADRDRNHALAYPWR